MLAEKRKQRPQVPFEAARRLRGAEDPLASRAETKRKSDEGAVAHSEKTGRPPRYSSMLKRIRGRRVLVKKDPGLTPDPEGLKMTTPKARELEKKYYATGKIREARSAMLRHAGLDWRKEIEKEESAIPALLSFSLLVEAEDGQTSNLEKRCVADVLAKPAKSKDGKTVRGARNRVSRAYAICRASLQKSGRYKEGTAELTKKGKGISAAKAKAKDNKSKVAAWKSAIKAARKKGK